MVCTITLQTNPAASGSGRSRHCRGSGFVDTVADRCSSANALTATAGSYSPATPSATNTPSRYTSAILGGGRRNAHPSTGAISSAGIRRRFARSDRAARARPVAAPPVYADNHRCAVRNGTPAAGRRQDQRNPVEHVRTEHRHPLVQVTAHGLPRPNYAGQLDWGSSGRCNT